MKLIDAEYTFDNNKVLFLFYGGRKEWDFRELVKDLASVFKTRIELRQVGVRMRRSWAESASAAGSVLPFPPV